jgi:hypothetical protein
MALRSSVHSQPTGREGPMSGIRLRSDADYAALLAQLKEEISPRRSAEPCSSPAECLSPRGSAVSKAACLRVVRARAGDEAVVECRRRDPIGG